MKYVTANTLVEKTDHLFTVGVDAGMQVGFECLNSLYKCKLGCTTYIGGIPSHGKSEFLFEMLMNLTDMNGWKHLVLSPETGSPAEIIGELAHKFIQKPFIKNELQMSQQEKYKADAYLTEYFYIADCTEADTTVDEMLNLALEVKQKHGLHTITIDPWNELTHNYEKHGGREDKYLEYILGKVRRFARQNNVHIFIIAHPRTLKPLNGQYEPPTAFELSGGAAWYAKAESIICVHRPDMKTNAAEIHIQKAKPKHIGKKGMCVLYLDYWKSRYYEQINGNKLYGRKIENKLPAVVPVQTEVEFKTNINDEGYSEVPF